MTDARVETDERRPEPAVSERTVRGRLIPQVCFAALIALLTLLVLEGVLRLYVAARGWTPNCYAAHLDLLRPHPVNGYDLKPEFELRSGAFRITTNSLGLRGPEIAMEKPPGAVRIAVLGGSSVFGYLVSDGDEAARHLEREWNAAGCDVEVINAGAPGYNLFQSLVRYRDVVAPLKPDVVVLYAGHNDLGYLCSEQPEADRWRKLPVASGWERCLGRSVLYGFTAYRLLGRGGTPGIGGQFDDDPTPAGVRQFRSNLATLEEAVAESGAVLVICAQASAARDGAAPELHHHIGATEAEIEQAIAVFDQMQDALESFAQERGVMFLDAGAEIPPTEEYLGDAIHLTAAGEERLADVLASGLEPLLPNCRGRRVDAVDERE